MINFTLYSQSQHLKMNFPEEPQIYTVTDLTLEIKQLLEGTYRFIRVQGEVSNLKDAFSGHTYFTLKDNTCQLKGVLFKGTKRFLERQLEDGQQIICHGRISLYEPRGEYQLIVDSVDFQGDGLLRQAFEKLKRKLAAEGLFADGNKKDVVPFPEEIVIITSPGGAAIHDFLKVWRNRGYPTNILIYPVLVQGERAAMEISNALANVNREFPDCDAVVLCRGGGSLEDLWAFNEEIVARAIARSKLAVVSAVGHEIDFTISDFCADIRAATPTAAAEKLIPDKRSVIDGLVKHKQTLYKSIIDLIDYERYRVEQNRRLLGDMGLIFTSSDMRLDHATEKFQAAMHDKLTTNERRCRELLMRLRSNSPMTVLETKQQRLAFFQEMIIVLFNKLMQKKEAQLGRTAALLDAVSPLATLARGYSIARLINKESGEKTVLLDSTQTTTGSMIEVRLHRGTLECEIISKS